MSETIDFEKKLESAKETLEKLQKPDINLKDAIKLYKSGKSELLKASKMLEDAKIELEEFNSKEDL